MKKPKRVTFLAYPDIQEMLVKIQKEIGQTTATSTIIYCINKVFKDL